MEVGRYMGKPWLAWGLVIRISGSSFYAGKLKLLTPMSCSLCPTFVYCSWNKPLERKFGPILALLKQGQLSTYWSAFGLRGGKRPSEKMAGARVGVLPFLELRPPIPQDSPPTQMLTCSDAKYILHTENPALFLCDAGIRFGFASANENIFLLDSRWYPWSLDGNTIDIEHL